MDLAQQQFLLLQLRLDDPLLGQYLQLPLALHAIGPYGEEGGHEQQYGPRGDRLDGQGTAFKLRLVLRDERVLLSAFVLLLHLSDLSASLRAEDRVVQRSGPLEMMERRIEPALLLEPFAEELMGVGLHIARLHRGGE